MAKTPNQNKQHYHYGNINQNVVAIEIYPVGFLKTTMIILRIM